jgi:hypothetical protein
MEKIKNNCPIKQFAITVNSRKVGICYYYDCFLAQKHCDNIYTINNENIRYSMDYFYKYDFMNLEEEVGIVKKLMQKIKRENCKEIILGHLGMNSLLAYIGNDFKYDNGYFIYRVQ